MCNVLAFSFDVRTDAQARRWWEEANKRSVRFERTVGFEVGVWPLLEEGQRWVSRLCFVFLGLLAFFHFKYVGCSLHAFAVISPYLYGFFPHLGWCSILGIDRCPADLPKMCSWLSLFSCLTLTILYLYASNTKGSLSQPTDSFICHFKGQFCRL